MMGCALPSCAAALVAAVGCLAAANLATAVEATTSSPLSQPVWPRHPRLRLRDGAGLSRVRSAVEGSNGDVLGRELFHNLSQRVDYILGTPLPSGSALLSSLQQDIYPLALLYRLSTNHTRRTMLARRAASELVRGLSIVVLFARHTKAGAARDSWQSLSWRPGASARRWATYASSRSPRRCKGWQSATIGYTTH
jgi:hypothetical protein